MNQEDKRFRDSCEITGEIVFMGLYLYIYLNRPKRPQPAELRSKQTTDSSFLPTPFFAFGDLISKMLSKTKQNLVLFPDPFMLGC